MVETVSICQVVEKYISQSKHKWSKPKETFKIKDYKDKYLFLKSVKINQVHLMLTLKSPASQMFLLMWKIKSNLMIFLQGFQKRSQRVQSKAKNLNMNSTKKILNK